MVLDLCRGYLKSSKMKFGCMGLYKNLKLSEKSVFIKLKRTQLELFTLHSYRLRSYSRLLVQ